MEINPVDLLTKDQKKELGKAVYTGLSKAIEEYDFSKTVEVIMDRVIDDSELLDYNQREQLGETFVERIEESLSSVNFKIEMKTEQE